MQQPSPPSHIIPTVNLLGHQDAVTCLHRSQDSPWLASGSEDGTVRLWDVQANAADGVRSARAVRCIRVNEPVNGVAVAPHGQALVYACAGNRVLAYDIRREDVVLTSHRRVYEWNSDEINSLHLNADASLLAASDDGGSVRIIDVMRHKLQTSLHKAHDNLCMSAIFAPNAPKRIVTGGMDCMVKLWTWQPKVRFMDRMQSGLVAQSEGQMTNPPFVYSCDACGARDKSWVVTGIGNGWASVYSVDQGKLELVKVLQGHRSSVSTVHWCSFGQPGRYLVTGGNDGHVIVWDMSKPKKKKRKRRRKRKGKPTQEEEQPQAQEPHEEVDQTDESESRGKAEAGGEGVGPQQELQQQQQPKATESHPSQSQASVECDFVSGPREGPTKQCMSTTAQPEKPLGVHGTSQPLWGGRVRIWFDHGDRKVNAVCSYDAGSTHVIYVADVSPVVTAYMLPT